MAHLLVSMPPSLSRSLPSPLLYRDLQRNDRGHYGAEAAEAVFTITLTCGALLWIAHDVVSCRSVVGPDPARGSGSGVVEMLSTAPLPASEADADPFARAVAPTGYEWRQQPIRAGDRHRDG